jgi:hypothetical protein
MYLLYHEDSPYKILQITVPDFNSPFKTANNITYTIDPELDPATLIRKSDQSTVETKDKEVTL